LGSRRGHSRDLWRGIRAAAAAGFVVEVDAAVVPVGALVVATSAGVAAAADVGAAGAATATSGKGLLR